MLTWPDSDLNKDCRGRMGKEEERGWVWCWDIAYTVYRGLGALLFDHHHHRRRQSICSAPTTL